MQVQARSGVGQVTEDAGASEAGQAQHTVELLAEMPNAVLSSLSAKAQGKRKADAMLDADSSGAREAKGIRATPSAQSVLAKTAPHLLESISGLDGRAATGSADASPRAVGSPALSDSTTGATSAVADEGIADETANAQAAAAAARSRKVLNGSMTPPVPSAMESRHKVPSDFRGPVPKVGDPEDVHPPPVVTLQVGSSLVGSVPAMFPMNRTGWRYDAAAPASDILPECVYKTVDILPRGIHWSWQDRSPWCYISKDASVVSAEKGFRAVRSNVGVREGAWYAEIELLAPETRDRANDIACNMKDGPHVRVGWGRREASLNAPVGGDGYSYGFRDTTGDRVSIARAIPYGRPFGAGDVIGIYIKLPPLKRPNPEDHSDPAIVRRKRVPIRYKGRLYFESLEYAASKEMNHLMDDSRRGIRKLDANGNIITAPQTEEEAAAAARKRRLAPGQVDPEALKREKMLASLRPLPTLEGSEIGFFVNGEPQGVAFENVLDYRPLRRPDKPVEEKSNARNNNRTVGLAVDPDDPGLTSSASAKALLKSRENPFDDGSAGYFPFVSLFGGACVRINPGPHFKYPPPNDVSAALREVEHRKKAADTKATSLASEPKATATSADERQDLDMADAGDEAQGAVAGVAFEQSKVAQEAVMLEARPTGRTWRPLSERYDEWVEEQWRLDLEDERREADSANRRREQIATYLAEHPDLELLPTGMIVKRNSAAARNSAKATQPPPSLSVSPAPEDMTATKATKATKTAQKRKATNAKPAQQNRRTAKRLPSEPPSMDGARLDHHSPSQEDGGAAHGSEHDKTLNGEDHGIAGDAESESDDELPLAQNIADRQSSSTPAAEPPQDLGEVGTESQQGRDSTRQSSPDDSDATSPAADSMEVDDTTDEIVHGGRANADTPGTSHAPSEDASHEPASKPVLSNQPATIESSSAMHAASHPSYRWPAEQSFWLNQASIGQQHLAPLQAQPRPRVAPGAQLKSTPLPQPQQEQMGFGFMSRQTVSSYQQQAHLSEWQAEFSRGHPVPNQDFAGAVSTSVPYSRSPAKPHPGPQHFDQRSGPYVDPVHSHLDFLSPGPMIPQQPAALYSHPPGSSLAHQYPVGPRIGEWQVDGRHRK